MGIAALAGVLALVTSRAVLASNDLGHTAGPNSTVTFLQDNLTTSVHNAFHWNDSHNVEPLDLTTTLYHSGQDREVNVHDKDYGDVGWAGRWWCSGWDTTFTICWFGEVDIDLVDGQPPSGSYANHLLCHEVGHALGLAHTGASSCMNPSATTITGYSIHDKSIINAKY